MSSNVLPSNYILEQQIVYLAWIYGCSGQGSEGCCLQGGEDDGWVLCRDGDEEGYLW